MQFSKFFPSMLILSFLLFGPGASAAEVHVCQVAMVVNDCLDQTEQKSDADRVERKNISEASQAEAKAESEKTLQVANTGVGAGALGTNKIDFLNLFNLIGLVAGGDGESMAGDIVRFEYTFIDPKEHNVGGKVNFSLDSTPSVSDAVRMALPEDGRDDKVSAFESSLQLDDDVTVSIEIATDDRTIKAHQETLDYLFKAVVAGADTRLDEAEKASTEAFRELIVAIDAHTQCPVVDEPQTCTFLQLAEAGGAVEAAGETLPAGLSPCAGTESCAQNIMELFLARMQRTAAYESDLKAAAQEANLTDFASLVDNERQFVFTATNQFRNELVGPNQFEAKLSYQGGGPSISDFRGEKELPTEPAARAAYLKSFTKYAADNEEALKKKVGWSLSASYAWIEEVDIMRPDDGLELQVDAIERWSVEAGFRRAVQWDEEEKMPTSLIELVGSWQDFSDDSSRQDRFVASLTWTQKIGEMSIPFGLVYSNKSEFVAMETDHQLSARFGIKFKIDDVGD